MGVRPQSKFGNESLSNVELKWKVASNKNFEKCASSFLSVFCEDCENEQKPIILLAVSSTWTLHMC